MELDFLFVGNALNLFWAVVAIATVFAVSRFADKLTGIEFKKWINGVEENPANSPILCIYFGLRWVGLCLLAGLIFS